MDWSVGGDGDGYVTPVSECVKCREETWEEGANTVVEVPVLEFFSLYMYVAAATVRIVEH